MTYCPKAKATKKDNFGFWYNLTSRCTITPRGGPARIFASEPDEVQAEQATGEQAPAVTLTDSNDISNPVTYGPVGPSVVPNIGGALPGG